LSSSASSAVAPSSQRISARSKLVIVSNQASGRLSLISGEALSGSVRLPFGSFVAVTASMKVAASRR